MFLKIDRLKKKSEKEKRVGDTCRLPPGNREGSGRPRQAKEGGDIKSTDIEAKVRHKRSTESHYEKEHHTRRGAGRAEGARAQLASLSSGFTLLVQVHSNAFPFPPKLPIKSICHRHVGHPPGGPVASGMYTAAPESGHNA